jgi:hypothetical protein
LSEGAQNCLDCGAVVEKGTERPVRVGRMAGEGVIISDRGFSLKARNTGKALLTIAVSHDREVVGALTASQTSHRSAD